jgi:drug/metabolite transporter (DMT)-like permease
MCFVAQRSGMEYIGPFLFNGIRELLGALTLLALWAVFALLSVFRGRIRADSAPSQRRSLLIGGIICGIALYLASNLQQIGMVYVTASKAAFITTLYIILVPVLGLLMRHRPHWNIWASVGIATVGLYLLCINSNFALELGDAVLVASAVFWAIHILAVGHFAPHLGFLRLVRLCIVQFSVAGVLSMLSAPFADSVFVSTPLSWEVIGFVTPELAYAGILSTGIAFTLAAVGQKHVKPQTAAVVMSLESVFGLLGGALLLGESLSSRELVGCGLMFIAVILTQINFKARPRAEGARFD